MPTQRHYAKVFKDALVNDLLEQLEESGERAAKQLERILTLVMRRTLRFSSQFGTLGFRDVEIDIESQVTVNKKGLRIELNVLMIDAKGNPHPVWHIIAFGRKDFIQRRTSPPLISRKGLRTVPGTLEVERYPGKNKEMFVIPAGTLVKGIEARRWYELAPDEFESRIKDLPTIKTLGLKIVDSRIRKPEIRF